MDKYNAGYFEILMKLYSSDMPLHCSYFAEEYIRTKRNLFANLSFLVEKGLIEKVKVFHTDQDSPCFKISEKGKILVENVFEKFPLIGDDFH